MSDDKSLAITPMSVLLIMMILAAMALIATGCHKAGDMGEVTPWDEFATPELAPPSGGTTPIPTESPVVIPDPDTTPNPYSLSSVKLVKLNDEEAAAGAPVPLRFKVKAVFSRALSDEEKAAVEAGFKILNPADEAVLCTPLWNDTSDQVVFTLGATLAYNTKYKLSVAGVDGEFRTHVRADINGDGFSDMLADEPLYSDAGGVVGRVWLISGKGIPPMTAGPLVGKNDGDYFGTKAVIVGDMNGDGYEDVAVSAPGFGANDTGKIYIYAGPSLTSLAELASTETDQNYQGLGNSMAGGCDINNDGLADLIVGAPFYNSNAGRVYVIRGGNPPAVHAKYDAPPSFGAENLGSAVACVFDQNGDNYHDVIAGAPSSGTGVGRIVLLKGPSLELLSARAGDVSGDKGFGRSLAVISDQDGDKIPDIIVGAPDTDSNKGLVRLVKGGADISATASLSITAPLTDPNDKFGSSVTSIPDIDPTLDGKDDILVGAQGFDQTPDDNRGAIFAYKVTSTGLVLITQRIGSMPGAGLGASLARIGDVNGDGKQDILAGEPGANSLPPPAKGKIIIVDSTAIPAPAPFAFQNGLTSSVFLGISVGGVTP